MTLLPPPQATDMDTSNMFPYVRAALIGHASRNHNTRNSRRRGSCAQLYSECPAHPDDIVNYLNNHKGGLVNQERSCVVTSGHRLILEISVDGHITSDNMAIA